MLGWLIKCISVGVEAGNWCSGTLHCISYFGQGVSAATIAGWRWRDTGDVALEKHGVRSRLIVYRWSSQFRTNCAGSVPSGQGTNDLGAVGPDCTCINVRTFSSRQLYGWLICVYSFEIEVCGAFVQRLALFMKPAKLQTLSAGAVASGMSSQTQSHSLAPLDAVSRHTPYRKLRATIYCCKIYSLVQKIKKLKFWSINVRMEPILSTLLDFFTVNNKELKIVVFGANWPKVATISQELVFDV